MYQTAGGLTVAFGDTSELYVWNLSNPTHEYLSQNVYLAQHIKIVTQESYPLITLLIKKD